MRGVQLRCTHLQTDLDRVTCQPTQQRLFKHSNYLDHHERRPRQGFHLKSIRVAVCPSFGLWFPYARTMSADWGEFAFKWAANSLQSDLDLRYDIRSMRHHLLQCLERQEVVPFPRLQHRAAKKTIVRKIKEITV